MSFVLQLAAQRHGGALALRAGIASMGAGLALVGGGNQRVAGLGCGEGDLHGRLLGTAAPLHLRGGRRAVVSGQGMSFVLQLAAQGHGGALALRAGTAAVGARQALVGGGDQRVAGLAGGDGDLHGTLLGTGCL